ncbi:AAA family ATPase [Halovulum sp. GXIMD14794]
MTNMKRPPTRLPDLTTLTPYQLAPIRFVRDEPAYKLERHLETFLRDLRCKARGLDATTYAQLVREDEWGEVVQACIPSKRDLERIRRRVDRLVALRRARSGMAQLPKDIRDLLEPLADGTALVRIETEHRADEIAATLHAEMPWLGRATEIAWHALRAGVREGAPGLHLPPILLDGPPGIGKSRWARRFGELVGVPVSVIDAAAEPAGFSVAGSQRGWGSAGPGRPIELFLRERIGNPVVLVDEIDKVGEVRTKSGVEFALTAALLSLLEPESARAWSCPYFRITFDMSWISWILTSNNRRRIPAPLLSRCRVVELPRLTGRQLAEFAQRQALARGLPGDVADELAAVLRRKKLGPDLRAVLRVIDGLVARESGAKLQ